MVLLQRKGKFGRGKYRHGIGARKARGRTRPGQYGISDALQAASKRRTVVYRKGQAVRQNNNKYGRLLHVAAVFKLMLQSILRSEILLIKYKKLKARIKSSVNFYRDLQY